MIGGIELRKKKILFVIWSFSYGGGAESLLTMIVNHLNSKKYDISILEIVHSNIKKELVKSYIKILEPITSESESEYTKKMFYLYHNPDAMIMRYIKQDYDLYISFNYQTPSFLLPKGKKNIAWIHGSVDSLMYAEEKGYRRCQDSAFYKAKKIVSISDITTQSIKKIFPAHTDKIVEIYNSIDAKKIGKMAEKSTDIRIVHPAIICIGRLDSNKDPLRVLEVLKCVHQVNKKVQLYYLGKGKLENSIRKRAENYQLSDSVHLLGYCENPFPIIKQCDIVIMMSKSEGFPMSLLECTALGIPFVSTDVGGARILSNNQTCGFVIESNEEAAKRVLKLLSCDKGHIKKICRESIKRFELKHYMNKIEELFDSVIWEENCEDKEETRCNLEVDGCTALEDRNYYYEFPAHLIKKGQRFVLYGAGNIGMDYNAFNNTADYGERILWIDKNYLKYRNKGMDVSDVRSIEDAEYDAVLIAVMNSETAMEIKNELLCYGVSGEKIKWSMPRFF